MAHKQAIQTIEQLNATGAVRKLAAFVLEYVDNLCDNAAFNELDTFLKQIDASVGLTPCCFILRSSYHASGQLKQFMPLLERTRLFYKDTPNIDRKLVGLDRPY